MKRLLLFVALLLGASLAAQPIQVRIDTDLGPIQIQLEPDKAPRTVANFLRYVDAKAYDGGRFWRTVRLDNQPDKLVKIQVIQGGAAREDKDFPPIALERTRDTGLRHLDGNLSMARAEPDTATNEFFICIGDQPELDFGGKRNPDGQGFAAFGRVVRGMEVVRKIQARPDKEQALLRPVRILSVQRLPARLGTKR